MEGMSHLFLDEKCVGSYFPFIHLPSAPFQIRFMVVQWTYMEICRIFSLCGSSHTDSIVAEDHDVANVFLRQVDR